MVRMINRATMLAAAAGIALAAGMAQAATPDEYVMKAGAGDQYEIQSSKLVLGTTNDPKLRRYAQKMIADHSKSTAMVKTAAKSAGLHPAPPALDADGESMIAALKGATGTARDQLYLSQQKAAHDKALALHQDYSRTGTAAPLKSAAAKIVPVVQQHESSLHMMGAHG